MWPFRVTGKRLSSPGRTIILPAAVADADLRSCPESGQIVGIDRGVHLNLIKRVTWAERFPPNQGAYECALFPASLTFEVLNNRVTHVSFQSLKTSTVYHILFPFFKCLCERKQRTTVKMVFFFNCTNNKSHVQRSRVNALKNTEVNTHLKFETFKS